MSDVDVGILVVFVCLLVAAGLGYVAGFMSGYMKACDHMDDEARNPPETEHGNG